MNQMNLPARLSTLNQQISVLTDRLSPATDETVTEAIKSLLSAGLSLPGGMAADKAPEIYAFALSKVSATGIRRVVSKLVRGEYDLRNKAFIPTPPEFADLARRETREIVDDLARLKGIRSSMMPETPLVHDEAAKTRVRGLIKGFLGAHAEAKAKERGQPVRMPMSPEQVDYWSKISALPDAENVGAEHHEQRRKIGNEIADLAMDANPERGAA